MVKIIGNGGIRSGKEIVEFEEIIGVSLPKEYREFINEYNGGYTEPSIFKVEDIGDATVLNELYGIPHEGDKVYWDLRRVYKSFDDFISNRFISIGDDPGGSQICLGIKDSVRGKIYFHDHESNEELPYDEDFGHIVDERSMYHLADSFNEFLDSLYEDEDDE